MRDWILRDRCVIVADPSGVVDFAEASDAPSSASAVRSAPESRNKIRASAGAWLGPEGGAL